MHGAGIHVTSPSGYLNSHIDYALHPNGRAERRLNLVLFLDEWKDSWGGAYELYDDSGTDVLSRIYPKKGSIVIWEPTDTAFHGTQRVTGEKDRRTAAVYYLSPVREGVTRKRALFVPRRSGR